MNVTERRREKMRKAARSELAKRGVMSFRMSEAHMSSLLELACDRKLHPGSMVRDWVIEQLKHEIGEAPSMAARVKCLEDEVQHLQLAIEKHGLLSRRTRK